MVNDDGPRPATGRPRWAVRWQPAPAARMRLLCLPHAAGSSFAYRGWGQRLAPEIEVISIRMPGTRTRSRGPGPARIQDLAAALVLDIAPLLDPPYAWFGHSMGALTAFELCRAARGLGLAGPVRLLVSGRPAPHIPPRHSPLHDSPASELAARLQGYSGTPVVPPQVLDDPSALRALIAVLRADLAVSETYRYHREPRLDCPITAFGGTDDPFATAGELSAWRSQTSAGCRVQMFPGGHFFLHEAPEDFLAALKKDLVSDGV
jgi:medium-chain acyl-[acyl-carrier-protein] hydrolase